MNALLLLEQLKSATQRLRILQIPEQEREERRNRQRRSLEIGLSRKHHQHLGERRVSIGRREEDH